MVRELTGIIGGSGLGDTLASDLTNIESVQVETPFGSPSGDILIGQIGKNQIAFLNRHGPGHKFAPSDVPFAANIFALKKLGVRSIIASGAVGSLSENIHPEELVIVDQFIDKTFRRQNSFFDTVAAVHCEMAEPVCGRLHKLLLEASKEIAIKTHNKGTYMCMEGPQFSTRAESLMHRKMGADLIGMTAMPEARLAREAQICYCVVALVSDYDCWKQRTDVKNKQTLLAEIIGHLQQATENAIKLITAVMEKDNLHSSNCTCRNSLDMAVWTKPQQIDKDKKEDLNVLFE